MVVRFGHGVSAILVLVSLASEHISIPFLCLSQHLPYTNLNYTSISYPVVEVPPPFRTESLSSYCFQVWCLWEGLGI